MGGTLGYRHGNFFEADSVFYDDISYAKFAVVALLHRLAHYGFTFIDGGMVTKFSESLKGEYIPAEEFTRLIKPTKETLTPIDFATPFNIEELTLPEMYVVEGKSPPHI